MRNIEQEERNCFKCALTDAEGKIAGGRFCVELVPDTREEFSERRETFGKQRFWSCQKQGSVEDCPVWAEVK